MSELKQVLMNTEDAAKFIGARQNVLRISRHTGEIYKGVSAPVFVKIGRAVRYRLQDLEAWIEKHASHSQRTTSENK